MQFLHQRQQLVRPLLFPLFVVLTTTAYGGVLPTPHHIKLHRRRHQHFVRPRSLVLHRWCHQQESHRPRSLVVTEVPDLIVALGEILRIVDIGEASVLHLDIEREGRIAVGDLVHTVAEGLGEGFLVHKLQQGTGMDVGDIPVGLVLTALRSLHIRHSPFSFSPYSFSPFYFHPCHTVASHHLTAMFADHVCQQFCKMAAASHETTGTVDVEHTDHGMHIGRCVSSLAAIERVHIGHHTAQPPVADILGDEVVSRHKEVVGVVIEVLTHRTEIEQVEFLRQFKEGVNITLQVLPFMGKVLGQRLDVGLPTLRDGIVTLVFREVETVSAIWIYILHAHLVCNTQVSADAPDVSSRLQASHDVHACVELFAEAYERLQTAADGSVLLQHGHLQSLLCQNSTAEQSAKTSTYDNDLFHFEL